MEDISKLDLYKLFEVDCDATVAEIKRAYRKKALKCHPDKNPDDAEAAADSFRRYNKALQVLVDETARAVYDKLYKARKDRETRNRLKDSKRQKLKDDLEAREKRAQEANDAENHRRMMEKELERLRKEGQWILEMEAEKIREEIEKERKAKQSRNEKNENNSRLKLKWDKSCSVSYDEQRLRHVFEKYGQLTAIVIGKKGQNALIEFSSTEAAIDAFKGESHQFKIEWIGGQSPIADTMKKEKAKYGNDFESVVLMKMRREEERKRLIAEMEKEETAE